MLIVFSFSTVSFTKNEDCFQVFGVPFRSASGHLDPRLAQTAIPLHRVVSPQDTLSI
jgi:hypothetical protein